MTDSIEADTRMRRHDAGFGQPCGAWRSRADLALVGEVPEEGAPGDPGPFGDLRHGGCVVSLLGEQIHSRDDESLARARFSIERFRRPQRSRNIVGPNYPNPFKPRQPLGVSTLSTGPYSLANLSAFPVDRSLVAAPPNAARRGRRGPACRRVPDSLDVDERYIYISSHARNEMEDRRVTLRTGLVGCPTRAVDQP